MGHLVLAALAVAVSVAAQPTFELCGEIPVSADSISVSIFGATNPFTESTLADPGGKFQFRKLPAGAYTISVNVPGRGEARRTVEIGPRTADSSGRVNVTLNLSPADFAFDDVTRQNSISARALSVSGRARHEWDEAHKKLARRDVDGAVEHLERAVEISPQFAEAWNTLGTIAYQRHDLRRAETCFRRSLDGNPGLYEALVNLGGTLVSENRPSDALPYNQHAAEERPADALANSQLGLTWYELGRLDLAEQYLDRALEIDPAHFSHPQLVLSEIHQREHRPRDAAEDLEDFLERHPDSPRAEELRETIAKLRATGE